MNLKKSISRIGFTIANQNKPNDTDVDAFNFLCDHLKKVEEKTIQDNLLFAKLYAYLLGKLLSHYNNVDEANKYLNKILQQPFLNTVGILEMELRAMEVRQVFADDFLQNQKPADVKKTLENYPNFSKEFLACWEYWDNENVISNLKANVNLSLQNFKNNV